MISSLAWIPRGAAKSVPEHAHISPDDVEALKAAAEAEAAEEQKMVSGSETSDSDSDEELSAEQTSRAHAAASQATGQSRGRVSDHFDISAAMKELDMDHYDSEGERGKMTLDRLLGGNDVSYKLEDSDEDDEDSDSEEEDLRIRDDDLLILAARNEDDVSHLEMWVYEQPDERGDGNLFVHHAILLPAFPLSLAWLDCGPNASNNSKRNLAAVGSFEPGIEIWDMDVLDTVEPIAVLGGLDSNATSSLDQNASSSSDPKKGKSKKKSSKKKSNSQLKPGSHEAPVLGLAWNKEFRNVLASASADKTVKIWDVVTGQASVTLNHHQGKVQAVEWNPVESPVLLSGGFDRRVCLSDVRTSAEAAEGDGCAAWTLTSDVEALAWSPHSPTQFAVSCESGEVVMYDTRNGPSSDPILRFSAHKKATTAVSFNFALPGYFLTAFTDKKVNLWEIDASSSTILKLASEDLKVGAVFTASFTRDAPMVMAAGGAKGTVAVWDTSLCEAVKEKFQQ